MTKKELKITPVSDYIYLRPDTPESGGFVVSNIINETAVVEAVGPLVSEATKKLVGKHVIFNAWACDEKTLQSEKVYFAPESANAICAVI